MSKIDYELYTFFISIVIVLGLILWIISPVEFISLIKIYIQAFKTNDRLQCVVIFTLGLGGVLIGLKVILGDR
jgi:hypothetical protein